MNAPPFAVVDIGSNTAHLLVAASDGRVVEPICDRSVTLGLGQAVTANGGRIGAAKTQELVQTLVDFAGEAAAAGAGPLQILATHALRVAGDGAAAMRAVEAAVGSPVTLITPQQEAAFSFRGATAEVPGLGLTLMIEIGGGSTQMALGADGVMTTSASLPLAGAHLTDRFFAGDPPAAGELDRLRVYVQTTLAPVLPPAPGPVLRAIGVGGSLRRLTELLGVPPGTRLPADWVIAATARLTELPVADLALRYSLPVERARVMLAGVLLADAILRAYGDPLCTVAAYGIREGAILALAHHTRLERGRTL